MQHIIQQTTRRRRLLVNGSRMAIEERYNELTRVVEEVVWKHEFNLGNK
jgi:hypothetical protein